MQTIYTAFVEIKTAPMRQLGPLRLRRTLKFITARERDEFIVIARGIGATIIRVGVDHILSADEAIEECRREQAAV